MTVINSALSYILLTMRQRECDNDQGNKSFGVTSLENFYCNINQALSYFPSGSRDNDDDEGYGKVIINQTKKKKGLT